MPTVLHESKTLQLNDGMKTMLKKSWEMVTNEIWLIVWKYAPNDKDRFEDFSEWYQDDATKVNSFIKLMAFDELKISNVAWNKIYKLFNEFDTLVNWYDTTIVVWNIFRDFNNNQFTATLNYNHFDVSEHQDILRCYCSYLGMKKWKKITEATLKKRSQYVYSYLKLYPKIESGNEEFDHWSTHWKDLQATYANQICPVLQNLTQA